MEQYGTARSDSQAGRCLGVDSLSQNETRDLEIGVIRKKMVTSEVGGSLGASREDQAS